MKTTILCEKQEETDNLKHITKSHKTTQLKKSVTPKHVILHALIT